jgi:hypothetical protein
LRRALVVIDMGSVLGQPQSAVDEEFLALVCADEELLRAEFEAIIEASWTEPPRSRPARGPAQPVRRGHPRLRDRPTPLQRPVLRTYVRQRSPPARLTPPPVEAST